MTTAVQTMMKVKTVRVGVIAGLIWCFVVCLQTINLTELRADSLEDYRKYEEYKEALKSKGGKPTDDEIRALSKLRATYQASLTKDLGVVLDGNASNKPGTMPANTGMAGDFIIEALAQGELVVREMRLKREDGYRQAANEIKRMIAENTRLTGEQRDTFLMMQRSLESGRDRYKEYFFNCWNHLKNYGDYPNLDRLFRFGRKLIWQDFTTAARTESEEIMGYINREKLSEGQLGALLQLHLMLKRGDYEYMDQAIDAWNDIKSGKNPDFALVGDDAKLVVSQEPRKEDLLDARFIVPSDLKAIKQEIINLKDRILGGDRSWLPSADETRKYANDPTVESINRRISGYQRALQDIQNELKTSGRYYDARRKRALVDDIRRLDFAIEAAQQERAIAAVSRGIHDRVANLRKEYEKRISSDINFFDLVGQMNSEFTSITTARTHLLLEEAIKEAGLDLSGGDGISRYKEQIGISRGKLDELDARFKREEKVLGIQGSVDAKIKTVAEATDMPKVLKEAIRYQLRAEEDLAIAEARGVQDVTDRKDKVKRTKDNMESTHKYLSSAAAYDKEIKWIKKEPQQRKTVESSGNLLEIEIEQKKAQVLEAKKAFLEVEYELEQGVALFNWSADAVANRRDYIDKMYYASLKEREGELKKLEVALSQERKKREEVAGGGREKPGSEIMAAPSQPPAMQAPKLAQAPKPAPPVGARGIMGQNERGIMGQNEAPAPAVRRVVMNEVILWSMAASKGRMEEEKYTQGEFAGQVKGYTYAIKDEKGNVLEVNRFGIAYKKDAEGKLVLGSDGKAVVEEYQEVTKDAAGVETGTLDKINIRYDTAGKEKSYQEILTTRDKPTGDMARTLTVMQDATKEPPAKTTATTMLDKDGNEKGVGSAKDEKDAEALKALRDINEASKAEGPTTAAPGTMKKIAQKRFKEGMAKLEQEFAKIDASRQDTIAKQEKLVDEGQRFRDMMKAQTMENLSKEGPAKEGVPSQRERRQ